MSKAVDGDLGALNVAVIGSGLSAVGAIKSLIHRGIRPTVFDWGEQLGSDREQRVAFLSTKSPEAWTAEERAWLNDNPTVKGQAAIPRKLAFGSDYFYGTSMKAAPISGAGNLPPFSYALGGLSSGWGAAVLPPHACDLADWPVDAAVLQKYCEIVLADLPYSAADDRLSRDFPPLSGAARPLQLSRAATRILWALEKARVQKPGETVFGQARLLVRAGDERESGCRYCGQCMSGCVYGAIYKAGHDILAMAARDEIDYIPRCLIDGLVENGDRVTVRYFDANEELHTREFDRVFLAAGAVNSARIVCNSLALFDEKIELKSRGGFVLPVFSLWRLPVDWPNCNTQPGLFLELKGKGLEHWVHVQISTENELVMKKLGIASGRTGFVARIKRFVAEHVFFLLVNYHSDHAGTYELRVKPAENTAVGANTMHTVQRKAFPQKGVMWASGLRLLKVFARIACLPLFPFAKLNSGAYHVGGTLPMKAEKSGPLDTDSLGRVGSWQRIHVVDTAVFPSLPGTTIGLLAMANAYRIVDNIHWFNQIGAQE
ncbi:MULTISPECIES: GMC oxidoreductase [unclassified Pandoraea]|uniref:GMC oxidoreductase n=1 Tax=unclassified Pandoraea TaxID=2624094 RepID=UPI00034932CA|nr:MULTISPECIES: GMC oxidoreductase [unclassified Pandoraea]